jgi:sulfur carrier protein ThiS
MSGLEEYEVPFEPGLRAIDLIHKEGFFGEEAEAIVVLLNDEQTTRDAAFSDGDRVEFLINMVGGSWLQRH